MSNIDEKFKLAAAMLNDKEKKPKLDMKQQLTLFGLYKQATEGKNTKPAPAKSDMAAYYKWTAWSKCGDMSKEDAKKKFVEFAKTVLPAEQKSKL
jgi:acyl-CoA-binding protein